MGSQCVPAAGGQLQECDRQVTSCLALPEKWGPLLVLSIPRWQREGVGGWMEEGTLLSTHRCL